MINARKRMGIYFVCIAMFVLAVMAFLLPTNLSDKSFSQSYENFYNTLMMMNDKYGTSTGCGVAKAESVEDELGYNDTRLVVDSTYQIDVYGADLWCAYNGTYILQYKDAAAAKNAYEKYKDSNLNVFYDLEISAGDTIVEDVVEADGAQINSNSFYSWGWKNSNDFLGVNSYLASLSAIDESSYQDVVVAVLDSGINTSHVMFKAKDNSSRILTDYARDYTGTGTYVDDNGHGSHVSGTIAEVTPDCVKILPLKVLNYEGKGSSTGIIAALNYLMTCRDEGKLNGLKVINMSLGITSSSISTDMVSAFATSIAGGINALYDNYDVLSVVSAGNEKQNTRNVVPANVAKALTISALELDDGILSYTETDDKLNFDGSYSNYGSEVDFAAPGTYIKSAYKGSSTSYATLSGTSMAAPHATACVALFYVHPDNVSVKFENYRDSSNNVCEGLISKLRSNSNKSSILTTNSYAYTSGQDRNNYYGYGCINISGFGTRVDGEVIFGESNIYHTSGFQTTLSYSKSAEYVGKTIRIYYTLEENLDSTQLKPSNMTRSNLVNVHQNGKSNKVTAVAYVYNDSSYTSVYARSNVSTKTYYLNNMDIESNYSITGNTITSYYGTQLETLVVPSTIGGATIQTIGQGSFASSSVKILQLPTSISSIAEKAFYLLKGNTDLQQVHYSGSNITIGSNAFRNCKNLTTFDVSGISKIDSLALYGTNIEQLSLPNVKTIGKNALSQTKLNYVFFGNKLEQVDAQTLTMNGDVYGFNDVAERFAELYAANYHDLKLAVVKDLGKKKYVRSGHSLTYSVVVNGYDVSYAGASGSLASKVSCTKQGTNNFKTTFSVTLSNVTSNGSFALSFTDTNGDSITTSTSNVTIATTTEYTLNAPSGNYEIYVDDDLVSNGYKLYQGIQYEIRVSSVEGYYVTNIVIAGTHANENQEVPVVVSANVVVSLTSGEKGDFSVDFNCQHGSLTDLVGNPVSSCEVEKNESITFKIEEEIGYKILRVNVNGELLLANADGSYTIENITKDIDVDVIFEQAYYVVDVTYMNSCGALYSDDLTSVAYGTRNFEIRVSPNVGYAIDFVTVNGKLVQVRDGKFTIDYVDDDMDVVVAFKKTKSIFSSDNASMVYYLIVFGGLFILFVFGRIVLAIVRKKKIEK